MAGRKTRDLNLTGVSVFHGMPSYAYETEAGTLTVAVGEGGACLIGGAAAWDLPKGKQDKYVRDAIKRAESEDSDA